MIRLAVIGTGWAGTRHVEAVRELGRKITIACLMDNDAEHLQATAQRFDITKTYTDYQRVLEDPQIDAVSICTPHHLHCDMAIAAAATGKHILVEKPMAMTVADATRMIDAAEQHGVKLYVAENVPYTPMSQFLRGVLNDDSLIGEFVTASFASGFRAPNFGYPGRRAWLTDPKQGGTGTWMLHGVHSMAQLRFIFGEITSIYLCEHKASSFERPDIEGTMTGVLTLERGGHITIIQSSEVRLRNQLGGYTIHGDHGSIHANNEGYRLFESGSDETDRMDTVAYPVQELSDYALEMEAFADYVLDGIDGATTGYSERRSLAIVEAGYESARSGMPIDLEVHFGAL